MAEQSPALKPSLFLLFTAVFLAAALWALQAPPGDPFSGRPDDSLMDLDALAVGEIAVLKLRHLQNSPPFPVLLLGNSRPLPVGARDLGLSEQEFFNLSLSGQSFRSNVLILEQLAEMGKLPAIALVNLDNAELQYYGNPTYPSAGPRLRQALNDIGQGLRRPDVGAADAARMVWRHSAVEWRLLTESLNYSRLYRALSGKAPVLSPDHGYRPDGSRISRRPFTPYRPGGFQSSSRGIAPGFLSYDLERLAAIAAKGVRVIVYETFLHPADAAQTNARPSEPAAATRLHWLQDCNRLHLECRPGPTRLPQQAAQDWVDGNHPPAAALAALLAEFLPPGGIKP